MSRQDLQTCASASSGVTAVTFYPGGGAPRREMVPTAMLPGETHGLYVVDVGEGECQPVFLTSGQALDRKAQRGGPEQTPFEVEQSIVTALWGRLPLVGRPGTGIR